MNGGARRWSSYLPLLLGGVVACSTAPTPPPPAAWPPAGDVRPILDRSFLIGGTDTLVLREFDDSVGSVREVIVVDSEVVIDSIAALIRGRVTQQMALQLDVRSLALKSVTDSIQYEIVVLQYGEGQLRGTRVAVDSAGRRDSVQLFMPLPPGTFDRRSLGLLLRLLPLNEGARYALPMFDSWSQRLTTVRVVVQDTVALRVGKSNVTAHAVLVQGNVFLLPRTYYVTVDPPRRLLRIEQGKFEWDLVNWRKH